MNKKEFINRIIGVRYVNRGLSMDGCDCYGLVYLYYKHVYKWSSLIAKEYKDYKDFTICFTEQLSEWAMVDSPQDGDCCFVCFNGDIPIHCGVYIGRNEVLHANGDPSTNQGQVCIWKLETMKRYLSRFHNLSESPRIEYYRPKELINE